MDEGMGNHIFHLQFKTISSGHKVLIESGGGGLETTLLMKVTVNLFIESSQALSKFLR